MEKLKKHKIGIIVLSILLVCVIGIMVWFAVSRNQPVEETGIDAYTVYVKDSEGSYVQGVYLQLYSKDGEKLSWLPYVSSDTGRVEYKKALEEGCYVEIVDVPVGYAADKSQKYTFDEEGRVTIILDSDTSIYVAKIGEIQYTSFADAVTMANSSGKDVVIELLADVEIKSVTIKNAHGKNITVNGNGHTITAEGTTNTFLVYQDNAVFEMNNVVINHKNASNAFQCYSPTTLNLTDVVVNATEGEKYMYALFNAFAAEGTTTFNFTRVDATMAVESKGSDAHSTIIRTGNAGQIKNVNLNLVDCNFDTTGATGRSGIIVMKGTTANIHMKNTNIQTMDAAAIRGIEQDISQTMVVENCKFGSKSAEFQKNPITGYQAQIGNVIYMKLTDAIAIAENAKGNTTIKLVRDLNQRVGIKPEAGKTITIDGNGKKVNVRDTRSGFVLEKANVPGGTVEFKNMTIGHSSTGYIIYTRQPATINLTDVNINATKCDNSLIYVAAKDSSTVNLNLTRVTANVDLGSYSDVDTIQQGIIRSGQTGEVKTLNVNMTDCNFDTTKASGRSGIVILKGTTATVNLVNSTINTKDTFAIRSQKQDVNLTNSTVTSAKATYQEYPIEGYETKIGDVFYTIENAIATANASKSDTTIKFVTDFTIKTFDVHNTKGKQVVFDGNGKTLTTSGGNNAFTGGGNMLFKNMTINHKNTGSIVQMTEIGTLNMTDVELKATQGTAYNYSLLNLFAKGDGSAMNLTRVNATMAVPGKGKDNHAAIIRTGNSNDAKTVSINLTDCNLDTTKATGRHGIVVMSKTDADIKLTNTTISTLDTYAIKSNEASLSQTIQLTNSTLTSNTAEYKENPIKGYEAQIGNVVYLNLEDALKEVYSADKGGTVTLLNDLNKRFVLQPINGKTITIDGNDKKVTLDGDISGFVVQEAATPGGTIELKNMLIEHNSTGYVIYTRQPATINLTDVVIEATKCSKSLIKTYGDKMDVNLNLTRVNVSVELEEDYATIPDANAIILTGEEEHAKNVNINLVDSAFDTRKATGLHGIVVGKGTIAKINLDNSKISTIGAAAIKSLENSEGEATIKDNCKIYSADADEMQGYAKQVGETWYVSFGSGLTLSSDMTLDLTGLKDVVIDTNGYCLTTTGTKDDSVTIESDAKMVIGEKTLYSSVAGLVEKANAASENVTITVVADSQINLSSINNTNGKTITIDSNGKTLTATGTLADKVTVLSGAKYSDADKTLYLGFDDAMSMANTATKDVTVTLGENVNKQININPKSERKITIDGDGHTYNITGSTYGFVIKDGSQGGTVEIKNITVGAGSSQNPFLIRTKGTTLNIVDVTVNGTNFANSMIYVQAKDCKTTLNLTRVNANMTWADSKYADSSTAANAIIRTAESNSAVGTVKINLDGCGFDTTKAKGVSGIVIMQKTVADITIKDSVIKTKGHVGKGGTAIYGYNNPATTNPIKITGNSLLQSGNSTAQADTIKNYSNVTGYPTANAIAAMSLDSASQKQETKTVTLEVPTNIFDAFVEWIKEFANKHGWNLEI